MFIFTFKEHQGYGGYPMGQGCCNGGNNNGGYGYGAAILLVLFILLVIIIGARAFDGSNNGRR